MSEWISVEDRLPDDGVEVIFIETWEGLPNSWNMYIGWRLDGGWKEQAHSIEVHGDAWTSHDVSDAYVTHWMPLPDPPGEQP